MTLSVAILAACGGEGEPDVRLSEVEPIVTDLVDRVVAQVSDEARPSGELGPQPCFSGPPVKDLGTKRLQYAYAIDVEPGAEADIAETLVQLLVDEGLDAREPRVLGDRVDQYLHGDGFLVGVIHAEASGVVTVRASTECLDP